jgi:hypothetical protein
LLAFGKHVLALGCGTLLSAAPLAPVELAPPASKPEPLILRPGEGDRRVRRVYGGARAIIKSIQAIAAHSHPGADEIIFVPSGRGVAEIGERKAPIEAGATIGSGERLWPVTLTVDSDQ